MPLSCPMNQEKKKRRLFLEFEEELQFLESFHEKLSLLQHKLENPPTTSPSSSPPTNQDDLEAAKQKVTTLLQEIDTKTKALFDKPHFEQHIELVKVLQRRLRKKLMRKRMVQFLKSPENSQGHRRYQIEREIIASEVIYGKRLHTLCSKFLVPFQSSEELTKILSPDDVRLIFFNIESLYSTSQNLLHRIQTGESTVLCSTSQQSLSLSAPTPPAPPLSDVHPLFPSKVSLGKHITELRHSFLMYTEYIINHEKARERLAELRASSPKFASLLRKIEQKAKLEGPPTLNKFLSLPIQRISRYSTLLSDLLKHTPPEHIDRERLVEGLEMVRQIAECLEDSKKGLLMAEKMASIAKNILDVPKDAPIVQPHRRYLTEGVLFRCDVFEEEVPIFVSPSRLSIRKSIIRGGALPFLGKGKEDASPFTGEMDPFHCFLFSDVLVITIDRAAYFGPKYKFVNFLGNYPSLQLEPSPKIPPPLADKADQFHFFALLFPRSSYLMATKTSEEKEGWLKHLGGVVEGAFSAEVAAEVQNDLLEPTRCEGVLLKQSAYLKIWSERYCLVRGTTLFLAMREGEAASVKIDLERSSFEPGDEELSFKLVEKDIYHLAAKSKIELRKWTHIISASGCGGLRPTAMDLHTNPFETRKAPRSEDLDIGVASGARAFDTRKAPRSDDLEIGTPAYQLAGKSLSGLEEETDDEFKAFDEHDLITVEFEISDEEEEEEEEEETEDPVAPAPRQVAWIREIERNAS